MGVTTRRQRITHRGGLLFRRGSFYSLWDGLEFTRWGRRSAKGGRPYDGVWPEFAKFVDTKGPRGRWTPPPAWDCGVERELTPEEQSYFKQHPPGPGGLVIDDNEDGYRAG